MPVEYRFSLKDPNILITHLSPIKEVKTKWIVCDAILGIFTGILNSVGEKKVMKQGNKLCVGIYSICSVVCFMHNADYEQKALLGMG